MKGIQGFPASHNFHANQSHTHRFSLLSPSAFHVCRMFNALSSAVADFVQLHLSNALTGPFVAFNSFRLTSSSSNQISSVA